MNSVGENIIRKLDMRQLRSEFPILHQTVNGRQLVYFDNAATTQKPQRVLDALESYYREYNSNIHRGLHTLAEKATSTFELSRKKAAEFINAPEIEEVIFTKGTTEGINLVAQTYGRKNFKKGDEIIITGMEHHSNIVPWQMIAEEKGAVLKIIPVSGKGEIDIEDFKKLISDKTRIVSLAFASNALGTVNPVKEVIEIAHSAGALVMIDGAQAAPHLSIDVQDLDCDFFAFSAHKMYGPTGVGVLYGKRVLLENMPPYQGGGEMIRQVTFKKTTYNDIPYKFEAGTPNIGDVIAFDESIDFILEHGRNSIAAHEEELIQFAHEKSKEIEDLVIYGEAAHKVSVFSFLINGVHPLDLGTMLDAQGIAVRTGHHCAQPLMDAFKIDGTVRASFGVYNTREEIQIMFDAIREIIKKLKK